MAAGGDGAGTADLERALMDALFTAEGRLDPAGVAARFDIPGCRYEFVREVLHDPRFTGPVMPSSSDLMFQTVGRFMARLSLERHRWLRAQFSGLFTPRRVERYRRRIHDRVHSLIDAMPDMGPVDLVSSVARPLPFSVISDVLGVPEDMQPWLATTMETFGRAVAGQRDRTNVERGNEAVAAMLDFFEQALEQRRQRPREDLLTQLASVSATDEQRSDLAANCIFFILAGHATTTSLLAAAVELLSLRDDLRLDFHQYPERWRTGVEELLRYVSPTTLTGALASVDAEVAGCPVPAGVQRTLVFAAANRDPKVFADPATLNLARDPNPHLAFSAGAHHCIGAPLARMHAEIALPALFDRLSGLKPVNDPTWLGSVPVRQIGTMQVTWDQKRNRPIEALPLRD